MSCDYMLGLNTEDLEEMRHVMTHNMNMNTSNQLKNTELHIMSLYNKYYDVDFLLKNGANVDEQNIMGITPLYYASYWGNYDIVKLLLENGANVNIKSIYNMTPLHGACIMGFLNVIELLLKYGANIEGTNSIGDTPIMIAQKRNNNDVILCLEREVNVKHDIKKRLYVMSLVIQRDVFKHFFIEKHSRKIRHNYMP